MISFSSAGVCCTVDRRAPAFVSIAGCRLTGGTPFSYVTLQERCDSEGARLIRTFGPVVAASFAGLRVVADRRATPEAPAADKGLRRSPSPTENRDHINAPHLSFFRQRRLRSRSAWQGHEGLRSRRPR